MNKEKALKLFKCLSEETRLLIVKELINKDLRACIIPNLINRAQNNTSMHLTKLQSNGLIKSRREGRSIIYSIADEDVKKIIELIN